MFLSVAVAEGGQREVELALDLLAHRAGDADAGGRRDLLQPGGDVDAVAQQVLALGDHIAKVDADAELHPPPRGQIGVAAL